MRNIDDIVKYYANCGVEAYTNYHDISTDWIDGDIAKKYLEKYGVSQQDQDCCDFVQKSVFYLDRQLPDMIFRKNFEFVTLLGGAMFEEKDLSQFKSCLKQVGEQHFVVVQDTFGFEPGTVNNVLRMRFPSDISWDELMSGNYISTVLFEPFYNHYYVFGESGEWGMYVANEGYIGDRQIAGGPAPIRLIGFNPKYRDIFRDTLEIPEGGYCENVDYILEEERPDIKEWVPEKYRK